MMSMSASWVPMCVAISGWPTWYVPRWPNAAAVRSSSSPRSAGCAAAPAWVSMRSPRPPTCNWRATSRWNGDRETSAPTVSHRVWCVRTSRARCGRIRCAIARRRATIRYSASANRMRSPERRSSWHRPPAVSSPATRWWWMAARQPASCCRRTSDLTRDEVEALDSADELAAFRDRFVLPDGVIYLDGNSLGALPKATPARVAQVVEQEWGQSLIRSWTDHGWIDLQFRVGEKIGRIIGAAPGTTVVTDSTSVNLFKLLAAALDQRPGRTVVLTEEGNFPTDLYVAQGLSAWLQRGHVLRSVPATRLEDTLDHQVAVLMLTHVNYRSG